MPIHMIIGGKDISLSSQAYHLLSMKSILEEQKM